jgi:hypothetical protein
MFLPDLSSVFFICEHAVFLKKAHTLAQEAFSNNYVRLVKVKRNVCGGNVCIETCRSLTKTCFPFGIDGPIQSQDYGTVTVIFRLDCSNRLLGVGMSYTN